MNHRKSSGWVRCGCLVALMLAANARAAAHKTENVFLIISDGFRWQEVFNGAEADLMTKENGGVRDTNALRNAFWRESPEARRAALLPFVWSEIATHGQVLGNRAKGSAVAVANGRKFSYPGYNEIITGAADRRIDSNDKIPNPNVSVFEWLNVREQFRGKVSIFGTWDDFPYIFNIARSRLPIWPVEVDALQQYKIAVPQCAADMLHDTTPIWDDMTFDSFLFHAVNGYVGQARPRVVFVGYGETDEWAHEGRYDQYLTSAHNVDDFVKRLWETVQSMPEYKDKTTFILTADHGRGNGLHAWRDHGEKVDGAEADWIAVIGPDTAPLGERSNVPAIGENQIAATIAALLGEDYHAAVTNSGAPIAELLPQASR